MGWVERGFMSGDTDDAAIANLARRLYDSPVIRKRNVEGYSRRAAAFRRACSAQPHRAVLPPRRYPAGPPAGHRDRPAQQHRDAADPVPVPGWLQPATRT